MNFKIQTKILFGALILLLTTMKLTPANDIEVTQEYQTDVYVSQSSTYAITIPKTVILSGTDGAGEYMVTVSGNIAGDEYILITPDDSFKMSQYGKKDVITKVTQDKTHFTFHDIEDGNSSAIGHIQMSEISAGAWVGRFNFNVVCRVDETLMNSDATFISDVITNSDFNSNSLTSESGANIDLNSSDGQILNDVEDGSVPMEDQAGQKEAASDDVLESNESEDVNQQEDLLEIHPNDNTEVESNDNLRDNPAATEESVCNDEYKYEGMIDGNIENPDII